VDNHGDHDSRADDLDNDRHQLAALRARVERNGGDDSQNDTGEQHVKLQPRVTTVEQLFVLDAGEAARAKRVLFARLNHCVDRGSRPAQVVGNQGEECVKRVRLHQIDENTKGHEGIGSKNGYPHEDGVHRQKQRCTRSQHGLPVIAILCVAPLQPDNNDVRQKRHQHEAERHSTELIERHLLSTNWDEFDKMEANSCRQKSKSKQTRCFIYSKL
jgi:hypothetical protein